MWRLECPLFESFSSESPVTNIQESNFIQKEKHVLIHQRAVPPYEGSKTKINKFEVIKCSRVKLNKTFLNHPDSPATVKNKRHAQIHAVESPLHRSSEHALRQFCSHSEKCRGLKVFRKETKEVTVNAYLGEIPPAVLHISSTSSRLSCFLRWYRLLMPAYLKHICWMQISCWESTPCSRSRHAWNLIIEEIGFTSQKMKQ